MSPFPSDLGVLVKVQEEQMTEVVFVSWKYFVVCDWNELFHFVLVMDCSKSNQRDRLGPKCSFAADLNPICRVQHNMSSEGEMLGLKIKMITLNMLLYFGGYWGVLIYSVFSLVLFQDPSYIQVLCNLRQPWPMINFINLLLELIEGLKDEAYMFYETEANILISCLVEKVC